MAYAFTASVTQLGTNAYLVTIDETDCSSTDEAQIGSDVLQGVPLQGQVIRQCVVLISGAATTVNGILGEVSDPPANPSRVVCENNPAVQPILTVNDTQGKATYYDPTTDASNTWGILFHRSRPDAGANNVIRTYYHILAAW